MSARLAMRFWITTAAAVLGIAATVALGLWQWGRGAQKDAVQAEIVQRATLPALDARQFLDARDGAAVLHRPVVLRGEWVARHTVFLDNRQMRGRIGFYVLTPLKLEGSGVPVLVERGWAPRNFVDREKLPPVETPAGIVEVRGLVSLPPSRLYEFDGAAQGPIRQNLDLDRFRVETGLALPGLAVQQTGAASEGLARDWPQPGSGAEKNYGYAFQWWAIAMLIAILYAWFQFIAPRRSARHA